ncbi:AAEL005883-PA [Aedes aegypti]|uniref:AAEL005883-PA n=1 Tax=Aedes aegypti TaxID=7159 RepID=Q178H8_AEDAE|nr:AAEL005883-PA [Aedes aegypti]
MQTNSKLSVTMKQNGKVTETLERSREDSKRALNRADGWALRLNPYNFEVEYVCGRENIADPSSRLYEGEDGSFDEGARSWELASLEVNKVGFLTEKEIEHATSKDTQLTEVLDALETDIWPKHLKQFQALRNELSMHEGMLTKTGCAVIPECLQQEAQSTPQAKNPQSGAIDRPTRVKRIPEYLKNYVSVVEEDIC